MNHRIHRNVTHRTGKNVRDSKCSWALAMCDDAMISWHLGFLHWLWCAKGIPTWLRMIKAPTCHWCFYISCKICIVFDPTGFPASPRPVERYMHVNVYISSFFVTHTSYTHIRNILTYIWQICMTHVHSQWPVARPFMRVAHGRVPWLLWMQWRPRLMSHQWDHWAVCYITKTRHMCTFPLAPGAHAKPRGTLGGPVMKPNVQVLQGDLSFYKCLISGTFFGMSTDFWKQQQFYNHETWILKFSWNYWQFPAPCIHSDLAKANLYNAMPFRHLCSTHGKIFLW